MLKPVIAVLFATVLSLATFPSLAQNCVSPLPIHNYLGYTGDTCTAGNPLPTYGGTGSPQNEVIYSFFAEYADAIFYIAATGGYAGSTAAVFLLPACTPSTDPIAFGAPGVPMPVSGLTDGQTYYVIVTADPGGPNAGCGQYALGISGPLPVSLQAFSIE